MSGEFPTLVEAKDGRGGGAERLSSLPMYDERYKTIFASPRMVEDLLRGFAARRWAGDLDFTALRKLSADYVSDDRLRRHGDNVWAGALSRRPSAAAGAGVSVQQRPADGVADPRLHEPSVSGAAPQQGPGIGRTGAAAGRVAGGAVQRRCAMASVARGD